MPSRGLEGRGAAGDVARRRACRGVPQPRPHAGRKPLSLCCSSLSGRPVWGCAGAGRGGAWRGPGISCKLARGARTAINVAVAGRGGTAGPAGLRGWTASLKIYPLRGKGPAADTDHRRRGRGRQGRRPPPPWPILARRPRSTAGLGQSSEPSGPSASCPSRPSRTNNRPRPACRPGSSPGIPCLPHCRRAAP